MDTNTGNGDGDNATRRTMIFRSPERARFTMISNALLEDVRLSWRARGLMAYLLSKPDYWQTSLAHLVRQAPEGREAVRAGLAELETLGYVKKDRVQDPRGRMTGWEYLLYEEPTEVGESDVGLGTNTEVGNPDVGVPAPSND